ncbi:Putative ribonuclease H protein At1g65750 [Linum perenne]
MLRGARPLIHDGRNTAFWTTRWLDSGARLIEFADTEASDFDIKESVADMIDDQGSWNFPKLRNIISDEALNMVAGMSPPSLDQGEDDWCWGLEANGKFSISSAYDLLRENHSHAEEIWDRIWRWQGPARINHFLWLAMQDKLLTNSQRVKRKIASDAGCCYCHDGIEDVTHILRDCPFAAGVWRLSGLPEANSSSWTMHRQDWLKFCLNSSNSTRIGITCWFLWKTRNDRIFSNDMSKPEQVAAKASAWTETVSRALERDQLLPNAKPSSVIQPSGKAAAGGLIRNEAGHCVAAYTMNLGICSVTRAELRGVIYGLNKAWELGYRKILVYMDSEAAINLLQGDDHPNHHHAAEVSQFRGLCNREWEVSLKHAYREANKAADHLANRGHSLPLGEHNVPTSDPDLGFFLRYDSFGISDLRSIVIDN